MDFENVASGNQLSVLQGATGSQTSGERSGRRKNRTRQTSRPKVIPLGSDTPPDNRSFFRKAADMGAARHSSYRDSASFGFDSKEHRANTTVKQALGRAFMAGTAGTGQKREAILNSVGINSGVASKTSKTKLDKAMLMAIPALAAVDAYMSLSNGDNLFEHFSGLVMPGAMISSGWQVGKNLGVAAHKASRHTRAAVVRSERGVTRSKEFKKTSPRDPQERKPRHKRGFFGTGRASQMTGKFKGSFVAQLGGGLAGAAVGGAAALLVVAPVLEGMTRSDGEVMKIAKGIRKAGLIQSNYEVTQGTLTSAQRGIERMRKSEISGRDMALTNEALILAGVL